MRVLSAFLTLLRAGLWENDVDTPGLFPLSPSEWAGVRAMSRQQTVEGVVFQGVCRLSEEMLPPDSLLLQWVAAADAIERRNAAMDSAVGEIFAFFRDAGLRPVLLKGQGVARFYERPQSRECGDIDIFFPQKDGMRLAVTSLARREIRHTCDADASVHFQWRGIPVELHSRMFDVAAPARRRILAASGSEKGLESLVLPPCGDEEIEMPSAFLNLLLLNTHILKHAIGWGIGIRQLCDMARACHCQSAMVSAGEMEKEILELGLLRWTRMLHSFLTGCLGLSPWSLPFSTKPLSHAPLLRLVIAGGNFGKGKRPDCDTTIRSTFQRKVATAAAFSKSARFSLRYAPGETVWTFLRLLSGQNKKTDYQLPHDD